jgi:anti-anti-sigma factor
MFSVDLSTRECDGHVVVALRGELDLVDAADVAAALAAAVAREPRIIVDLAGLEFIDCSGVAALARGRRHARHAGRGACCSPRRSSGCCGFLRSPAWSVNSPSMPAWKRRPAAPDAPGGRPCRCRSGSARYAGRAPPRGQERKPWGAEHGNPRQQAGGAGARSPSAAAHKGQCPSWAARVSGRLPARRPGRIQPPDPLRWLRG